VLRITTEKSQEYTSLKLEGKLSGPWVMELERIWREAGRESKGESTIVDLSEVTFMDTEGQKLLVRMHERGVKFRASGCLNRNIVERIERGQPPPGVCCGPGEP
jgi:anti-anti-sigma regulatory factor